MLEGITILNEYPIMDYVFNWQVGLWTGVIAFMGLFIILKIVQDIDWFSTIAVAAFVSALCVVSIGGIFAREVPTSAKEYQVTIEDSVSINDVYDYYEVVDKEGDIWTIRKLIDQR